MQPCTFGCNSPVHDLGLGVAKSCEIAMSGHMAYTVTWKICIFLMTMKNWDLWEIAFSFG